MRAFTTVCIAIFCLCGFSHAESEWQASLRKNGITIETRPVSGSHYKEFKATMTAKTTLAKAVAVMADISGYTT